MTGRSLVHQPVLLTPSSGAAVHSAGVLAHAGEENALDRLCAEQFDAMRNPLSRERKVSTSTCGTSSSSSNIDVAPSSASSTRIINRIYRPKSHKSAETSETSSRSARGSALSSLSRFGTRTSGNQTASAVSGRNDERSYSRSTRDDDASQCTSGRQGPPTAVVSAASDLLPRLHSGSSGNNLLATQSTATSTALTSLSKTQVSLPTPGNGSSEPKYSGRPRGLVGLQNLGNTCFMNSCLQCVSNLPAIVAYFQSGEYLKEVNQSGPTKGVLAAAFGDLIKALWTSPQFTATRPVELKRVIGKVASRFTGYDQQDAQEFLRFLLDGLQEDLNRVLKKPPYYEIKDRANARDREVSDEYWKFYADRNHSALSDLFCGQLRSEIQCHTCQHRSLCFDVFWDLSVPVPKKPKPSGHHLRMFASSKDNSSPSSTSSTTSGCSIQECLKAYTDQECLDDSDSYYCAKCKTHRAVSKKISLYRLPEVLVIHLKRFAYSTFSRDKVTTAIQIPQHGLDVSACCAQDAVLDGSTLYDLAGVVHHVGSLSGGHYTAECLNADTSEWYDFNDATVSPVKKPQLTSASAYILFFRRRAEKTLTI